MTDIRKIADEAEMIVDGYAFTRCKYGFRILNLNNPSKAAMLTDKGEVLETSMDDIELSIVKEYLEKNRDLLEV